MISRGAALTAIVARALWSPGDLPPDWSDVDVSALIDVASHHRVLLLLGWMLREANRLGDWPSEFVEAFSRDERQALSIDCVRQAELGAVLRRLDQVGVRGLLFKGAALAHTHYPAPHVRVRADTDVFVPAEDVSALESVLQHLGYTRPVETSGDLVSYQSHYEKTDRYGVTHAFDIHWRISNLQALANCVTHAELWSRRVPVVQIDPSAMTVDAPHALLLALVHRAGHHPTSRNLLWMYELRRLEDGLTADERLRVDELAAAGGLGRVVSEGLAVARECFDEDVNRPQVRRQGPPTLARTLSLDLQALPDWRMRGRLFREHLLPPSSYMRAKYGVRSNAMLPALYIWRALHGMPKWLRRPAEE